MNKNGRLQDWERFIYCAILKVKESVKLIHTPCWMDCCTCNSANEYVTGTLILAHALNNHSE